MEWKTPKDKPHHFDFAGTFPFKTSWRNVEKTFPEAKVVKTPCPQLVVVIEHDGSDMISLLTADGTLKWKIFAVEKDVFSAMLTLAAEYDHEKESAYPPFNPDNVKPVMDYLKKNEKTLFKKLGVEYPFKEVKTAAKVCEEFMKEFMEQYNKDQIIANEPSYDDYEAGAGPVAVAQFVSVDPQVDDDCSVIGVSAQEEPRMAGSKRSLDDFVDLSHSP